jgi:NAD(P)-dependent dehydrogenase (short-subunit alcohol dehydrogenase family)
MPIQEFFKAGAKIAFVDIDEPAGRENEEYIKRNGGQVLFFPGDISDELTLKKFTEAVISQYGNIDYLINNACISRGGILDPCTYDDFNYVLRIGITAPYMLSQLFLPYFNKNACIVNISSSRAFMSQANTESYTAAKGGITALTHALAVSLSGRVRVNSIAPGWIDTGKYYDESYIPQYAEADIAQHPSNRVGEPMDIARAVCSCVMSETALLMGKILTIDGGMTKLMIYSGDNGWEYNSK